VRSEKRHDMANQALETNSAPGYLIRFFNVRFWRGLRPVRC